MRRVQQVVEVVLVFVAFSVACFLLASFVLAVGATALAIYVGALLAVWLFAAYLLPMLFGVMTPSEIVDNIRSRRVTRTDEGEPLPRGPEDIEGEPLPERRLGIPVPFEAD